MLVSSIDNPFSSVDNPVSSSGVENERMIRAFVYFSTPLEMTKAARNDKGCLKWLKRSTEQLSTVNCEPNNHELKKTKEFEKE